MWVAFATTCVTSSMFVTALAPNLLRSTSRRTATGVEITWTEWLVGFLPVGALLLLAAAVAHLPAPSAGRSRTSAEVPRWAAARAGGAWAA